MFFKPEGQSQNHKSPKSKLQSPKQIQNPQQIIANETLIYSFPPCLSQAGTKGEEIWGLTI
jgi:hypothetical protein